MISFERERALIWLSKRRLTPCFCRYLCSLQCWLSDRDCGQFSSPYTICGTRDQTSALTARRTLALVLRGSTKYGDNLTGRGAEIWSAALIWVPSSKKTSCPFWFFKRASKWHTRSFSFSASKVPSKSFWHDTNTENSVVNSSAYTVNFIGFRDFSLENFGRTHGNESYTAGVNRHTKTG